MRRVLEAEAKSTGLMARVVERAGRKLRHQVPGLQCTVECSNQHCFLHRTGGKGDCRREGCVYRGHCLTCEERGPKTRPVVNRDGEVSIEEVEERAGGVTAYYTGESGFSLSVRGGQHLEALENPQSNKDNAFTKHSAEYHQGEEQDVQYAMELVGHFSKPVERQVCEGVVIHSDPSDLVLNSKLDHHLPAVARVAFSNAAADRGERRRGGGRGGVRGGGRGGGSRGGRGGTRTPGL